MPEVALTSLIRNRAGRDELERLLSSQHGVFARLGDVWNLLGFRTPDAARKAAEQGRLSLKSFRLPGHRGHFVLTGDLARWLEEVGNCPTLASNPDIQRGGNGKRS